ncbi:class I SAM-dependent methyltransferase [Aeromicrobium alkaliterrae]|uniref:Class I SAM-dependent methyltransferase n=1 Tax=Aeromicrobium alkaliterrae TaxID=302168 RepID=A0ABP4VUU8_9ACTN
MEPTPNARTVESYEDVALSYARETSGSRVLAGALARLTQAVPGGDVLEIGSGPGWDADRLEDAGLHVRRTDLTQAFIALQRGRGKEIDRLDVINDELGGPYDAVLMLHVLQHVETQDLAPVLGKIAEALRPGGQFLVSVPRGEGSGWEVGESGRSYYRALRTEDEILDALRGAGLSPVWIDRAPADDGWLAVMAQRPCGGPS